MSLLEKIRHYGTLIRFSHTIFALPFALASVALAWPSHPVTPRVFFWILIAMIGARSAAMAFNRLVDRKFDALTHATMGTASGIRQSLGGCHTDGRQLSDFRLRRV